MGSGWSALGNTARRRSGGWLDFASPSREKLAPGCVRHSAVQRRAIPLGSTHHQPAKRPFGSMLGGAHDETRLLEALLADLERGQLPAESLLIVQRLAASKRPASSEELSLW